MIFTINKQEYDLTFTGPAGRLSKHRRQRKNQNKKQLRAAAKRAKKARNINHKNR